MQNKQSEKNKQHRLRLSVDIRSIKDQQFTAQIYIKYSSIPDLGIKNFRNSPTLQITNTKQEKNLPNAFVSYYFDSNGEALQQKLNKILEIQVWHSDRLQKDTLLGITQIKLNELLNMSLRKTKQSYARVFDAYLPLDQVDEQHKPIKKVGTLRTIVYLQDLGPVNMLKQKQEKLGLRANNQQEEFKNYNPPGLPSQNIVENEGLNYQQRSRQAQLNELQYKVVWELQTWKKAQQAKTKIHLKQKQVEFWASLSEEQKKQDLQKQKFFKKIQANLNLLQNKLKAKSGDLQKREQKLVLLQQEIQNKITQLSRQLLSKDEELENLRKKNKQEKASWTKQKSTLDLEIQRLKNQNSKLKFQLEEASKEDQKSPLFLIKTQLNNKYSQIKQLNNQISKAIQAKDSYKVYYDKMRNEVVRLKGELQKKNQSIQTIKYENQALKANVKLLQQQQILQSQQYHQQYGSNNNYIQAPERENEQRHFNSQLQRLQHERQGLLDSGNYSPNEPLIKQYDKQIKLLS